MTDVFSLVYRSAVSGRIMGEVFDDIDKLEIYAKSNLCTMKDGHYMIFKGDYKEVTL